jgi:PEGA domain
VSNSPVIFHRFNRNREQTCAMKIFLRSLLCVLLLCQSPSNSMASFQQETATKQDSATPDPKSTLEDGTPVKLRISQDVSSASAHLNDRVEFEVVGDIRVGDTLIIPSGGIAWGTVTEAQPKRRLGRGGKLEIVMDSVRLIDGEKAALRATKEVRGGSHAGLMTAGIIASGVLFFPVAPLFLFMHGKDIAVPKGTELSTFINGNFVLDMTKFKPADAVQAPAEISSDTNSQVTVASTPAGAEIQVDGVSVGSTPSAIKVTAGDHTITVKKAGFTPWGKKITVSGGNMQISAELEASGETQPAQ